MWNSNVFEFATSSTGHERRSTVNQRKLYRPMEIVMNKVELEMTLGSDHLIFSPMPCKDSTCENLSEASARQWSVTRAWQRCQTPIIFPVIHWSMTGNLRRFPGVFSRSVTSELLHPLIWNLGWKSPTKFGEWQYSFFKSSRWSAILVQLFLDPIWMPGRRNRKEMKMCTGIENIN